MHVEKGMRIGRLIVGERFFGDYWVCFCDCGATIEVKDRQLRNRRRKSCGCLQVERTKEAATKHGATAGGSWTTEYKAYRTMRTGARRHNMECDWDDFQEFLKEVGHAPEGHNICFGRLDTSKGWVRGNCQWISRSEIGRTTNAPRRKLTDAEVVEIQIRHADGERLQDLKDDYGIGYTTAWKASVGGYGFESQ